MFLFHVEVKKGFYLKVLRKGNENIRKRERNNILNEEQRLLQWQREPWYTTRIKTWYYISQKGERGHMLRQHMHLYLKLPLDFALYSSHHPCFSYGISLSADSKWVKITYYLSAQLFFFKIFTQRHLTRACCMLISL